MKDNDLEKVAGGHIFKNYSGQYEIINEIGNVVETYDDIETALARCSDLGFSTDLIEWDDLYKLREENGQNEKGNGINLHYPNPFMGK